MDQINKRLISTPVLKILLFVIIVSKTIKDVPRGCVCVSVCAEGGGGGGCFITIFFEAFGILTKCVVKISEPNAVGKFGVFYH